MEPVSFSGGVGVFWAAAAAWCLRAGRPPPLGCGRAHDLLGGAGMFWPLTAAAVILLDVCAVALGGFLGRLTPGGEWGGLWIAAIEMAAVFRSTPHVRIERFARFV